MTHVQYCHSNNRLSFLKISHVINFYFTFCRPEKGPAITFGMCLPASCPTDVLTTLINEQIAQKVKNVSINILQNSCQFQEDITEWRTLDKVTM